MRKDRYEIQLLPGLSTAEIVCVANYFSRYVRMVNDRLRLQNVKYRVKKIFRKDGFFVVCVAEKFHNF